MSLQHWSDEEKTAVEQRLRIAESNYDKYQKGMEWELEWRQAKIEQLNYKLNQKEGTLFALGFCNLIWPVLFFIYMVIHR